MSEGNASEKASTPDWRKLYEFTSEGRSPDSQLLLI